MPDVLYEKRDHYAIFTLNRPDRLNAMNWDLAVDLVITSYSIHYTKLYDGSSSATPERSSSSTIASVATR